MTADQPVKKGDLSPKDVARLDDEEYEEPGRDLLATKPAADGPGDVDNPVADERSHGTSGPDGIKRAERGARHFDYRKGGGL